MATTDDFVINSNGLGYMAPSSEKIIGGVQTDAGVKGDDTMEVRFEFGYVMSHFWVLVLDHVLVPDVLTLTLIVIVAAFIFCSPLNPSMLLTFPASFPVLPLPSR